MIPEGWEYVKLADVATVRRGAGSQYLTYVESPEQGVRLIRIGDFLADDKVYVERTRHVDRFILSKGDILIAGTGATAGIVFEIPDEFDGLAFSYNAPLIQVSPSASKKYIFKVLSSQIVIQQQNALFTGNAQPFLDTKAISGFRIPLPPLPEQRRIAEILVTWDRAIETVEALIVNARAQKKALMQFLLTGERRLPGFSEEWPVTSLGQLGETYGGLAGKSKADFGQGYPFITYKNVFDNAVVDPTNVELVTVDKAERQHRIRLGDILFKTSSETPNDVGMSSVVAFKPGDTYLNSFCFGFRPNAAEAIVPGFAAHFFRCEEMRTKIAALAQGSTRYNISKGQLLKLRFALPGSNEQQAIAGVLDAAESEIGRLKAQLIALRKEKSALMQQLLTGKRRVKINEKEDA